MSVRSRIKLEFGNVGFWGEGKGSNWNLEMLHGFWGGGEKSAFWSIGLNGIVKSKPYQNWTAIINALLLFLGLIQCKQIIALVQCLVFQSNTFIFAVIAFSLKLPDAEFKKKLHWIDSITSEPLRKKPYHHRSLKGTSTATKESL